MQTDIKTFHVKCLLEGALFKELGEEELALQVSFIKSLGADCLKLNTFFITSLLKFQILIHVLQIFTNIVLLETFLNQKIACNYSRE